MNKYKRNINQERRKQVLEYINENYSLSMLLKDLGVWDGILPVIKCPFHPDSRPSFNIDSDNNRYKCFSCGSGGGYMSFYFKYHTETLEETKYFNDYVEDILSNDYDMQEYLGFSTIFIKLENSIPLSELKEFRYDTPTFVNVDTRNLESIRRKVIKEDIGTLMDFYADVERGILIDDLWNKYYLGIHSENIKTIIQNKELIMAEFDALFDDMDNNIDDVGDIDAVSLSNITTQPILTDNQSIKPTVTTNSQSIISNDITALFSGDIDDIPLMDSFGNVTK